MSEADEIRYRAARGQAPSPLRIEGQTTSGPPPAPLGLDGGSARQHHLHLRDRRKRRRPKIRKRRLLFILGGFLFLAGISSLFGMLTAVASDLPHLSTRFDYKSRVDSLLYSEGGQLIGSLAPPNAAVIDPYNEIAPNMVNAIVSVEDKRFFSDPGIDLRGLARALVSDVTGGPREGGSTISEEFIKNVLAQENDRTVFEKLREAGLAFQLAHHWTPQHIMDAYLNTIYFGNGAYGIEAAARTYFGWAYGYKANDPGGEAKSACGDPDVASPHRPSCASELKPWQSALLAGIVADPDAFDPVLHPAAARGRRNQVLQLMLAQHYISRAMYIKSINQPLPTAAEIQQPEEPAAAPYFTSWVRPLIIRALEKEGVSAKEAQYEAFYGGLKIKLSINLQMQDAAQNVIDTEFPPGSNGPTASLVAIDNSNGEVRAMVSGDGNYQQDPFNLATLGYRQPGSSFKMFTLAAALSTGRYGPDSVFDSKRITIPYTTGHGKNIYHGRFPVHNFDNAYNGPETLATATAISDNSVFAQLGVAVGTKHVKHYAQAMGIRSPISTTPAMILGGLHQGVSALDMAHAYETAATGGEKIYNNILGDYNQGAVGIASISGCVPCRQHTITNAHPNRRRVLSPEVADEIGQLLHGPVDDPAGTGTRAYIPGVDVSGKTGTTSNYVDAWFVGWTPQMTVAVWVGYPNSGRPMLHNFEGGPVEGGTFPAIIWHNFMVEALQILAGDAVSHQRLSTGSTTTTPSSTTSTTSTTPTSHHQTTTPGQTTKPQTTPQQTTPQQTTPGTTTPGGTSGGGGL